MHSNSSCFQKSLILFLALVTQIIILFVIINYFIYYLYTISNRVWKIIAAILFGILGLELELNFLFAVLKNPGSINIGWSEVNLKYVKFDSEEDKMRFIELHPNIELSPNGSRYEYCFHCNLVKPERAHHCSVCKKCYLRMDHHCPWIGNCIGLKNIKYFVKTLLFATLLCIFIISTWSRTLFRGLKDESIDDVNMINFSLTLISYMLSVILLFCCLVIFVDQMIMICKNMTMIESLIYENKVFYK